MTGLIIFCVVFSCLLYLAARPDMSTTTEAPLDSFDLKKVISNEPPVSRGDWWGPWGDSSVVYDPEFDAFLEGLTQEKMNYWINAICEEDRCDTDEALNQIEWEIDEHREAKLDHDFDYHYIDIFPELSLRTATEEELSSARDDEYLMLEALFVRGLIHPDNSPDYLAQHHLDRLDRNFPGVFGRLKEFNPELYPDLHSTLDEENEMNDALASLVGRDDPYADPDCLSCNGVGDYEDSIETDDGLIEFDSTCHCVLKRIKEEDAFPGRAVPQHLPEYIPEIGEEICLSNTVMITQPDYLTEEMPSWDDDSASVNPITVHFEGKG